MPSAPTRRAQTSKQAKAAYKTRGASFVSPAEKKRLERGAELLARANRIKAQEARKKEWQEKRAREQSKQDGDPNLSSQRRLDKFGYASSQFHLGKFFTTTRQTTNLNNGTDAQVTSHAGNDTAQATESAAQSDEDTPPTSPVDFSDFLESNTQIARDLDDEHPSPAPEPPRPETDSSPRKDQRLSSPLIIPGHEQPTAMPPAPYPPISPTAAKQQNFPSFSSDFDDDTLARLDGVAEELQLRQLGAKVAPCRMGPPAKPSVRTFPNPFPAPRAAGIHKRRTG
ncbi:hypothetical protein CAC42_4180 [Sphaceloma murrayae]|uniref:Uncharacterized protein n=1 Tax=Sphaceloma murrayae TaxID=2082308 RepID=A0A2K1QKP0_9PEZI|nr:hypothetical protein CAC42_4180 [Sphaceloma murrayae]